MRLTPEELRASVGAVAKDVADAYARFDPPFEDREVADRFARLPGVHPAVAERLAAAHCSMSEEFGDGEKAALLIACGIAQAALALLPAEGRANLPGAVDVATGRPAAWVETSAKPLRSPKEVEDIATTAAAGNAALGAAIREAMMRGGRDGIFHIRAGEAGSPPGITIVDGEWPGEHGWNETVVVRGATEEETAALYSRACTALYAAAAGVAMGSVPGGGVAYALAADTLRDESEEDSVSGFAARAVIVGLETPLRVRALAAGADANALLGALQNHPERAFDQIAGKLVPPTEGPVDAARVVQAAIREAGRTACDLLRMAL